MGNQISTKVTQVSNKHFVSERIFDNIGNGVLIEIGRYNNKYPTQGIRLNYNTIYGLQEFKKTDDKLYYKFENDTHLEVYRKNNEIWYKANIDGYKLEKSIDPAITKFYKKISWDSDELDELHNFYNQHQIQ